MPASDYVPASDWRCPHCRRYVADRVVSYNDERGEAYGFCRRCGPVECEVLGWWDGEHAETFC